MTQKVDPVFLKHFHIRSKIQYIYDVRVQKGLEDKFGKSWKRFYKKLKPEKTARFKRFDAFFKRLNKEGYNDTDSDRIAIRFINKKIGYGVFAKKDIPPYSLLNHYAGIFRLDKNVDLENDSTFTFEDFPKYAIDAVNYGNWVRFMNHGKERDPLTNTVPWEHYLPEGPRIIFTASHRGIKKGQQLLYPYGDLYWEDDGFHGW